MPVLHFPWNAQTVKIIRNQRRTAPYVPLWALVASMLSPLTAFAEGIESWRVIGSIYTAHFDPEPDHNNQSRLIGLEAWRDDHWHAGLALFENSYDQPSQYLYVGYARNFDNAGRFYWRLTGGLIHGYKEPYEDKIPFNGLGVAPGIVPIVGFRTGRLFGEVQTLGTSGAMLTIGWTFADSGLD